MKNLLISGLVAASANAHADWQRIDASFSDVTLYVDHESASKSGDHRVQIYHILDYNSPQPLQPTSRPLIRSFCAATEIDR